MRNTLKTAKHNDLGRAVPVFEQDLVPLSLCTSDARAAYDAWQEINAHGETLRLAQRAEGAAWVKDNPESDYADHEEWLHAMRKHLREHDAALAANAAKSLTALLNFDRVSRAPGGMLPAEAAALHHDAEVRRLWSELMAAMAAREEAITYTRGKFTNRGTRAAELVTHLDNAVQTLGTMVRAFRETSAAPMAPGRTMVQSFRTVYAAEATRSAK